MPSYRNDTTVNIRVIAPKIVQRPVIFKADLSETWMKFFVDKCGLRISRKDGIFVRTVKPLTASRQNGTRCGWKAELDEKIGVFINKYERRHTQHTVILVSPRTRKGAQQGGSGNTEIAPNPTLIPWVGPAPNIPKIQEFNLGFNPLPRITNDNTNTFCQPVVRSTSSGSGIPYNSSFNTGLLQNIVGSGERLADHLENSSAQNVVENIVTQINSPNWDGETIDLTASTDDETYESEGEDNTSLCATPGQQEEGELLDEGIQVENNEAAATTATDDVLNVMSGFPGSFYLDVQNELQNLKAAGMWTNNYNTSPIAFGLLKIIFNV